MIYWAKSAKSVCRSELCLKYIEVLFDKSKVGGISFGNSLFYYAVEGGEM